MAFHQSQSFHIAHRFSGGNEYDEWFFSSQAEALGDLKITCILNE
jgi:hypothetical protein